MLLTPDTKQPHPSCGSVRFPTPRLRSKGMLPRILGNIARDCSRDFRDFGTVINSEQWLEQTDSCGPEEQRSMGGIFRSLSQLSFYLPTRLPYRASLSC